MANNGRMRSATLCFALASLFFMGRPHPAAAADAFAVSNGTRIVFLGDSITYSGEYVSDVEAAARRQQPALRFEIINVGLPSETVSGLSEPGHAGGSFPRPDLHERLDRVLAKLKPDLVFACYGMNDGIYYPFSEERFAAFTNGIMRLHAKLNSTGARIIHLTPPVFDAVPLKGKTLPAGLSEYRQPYVGYDDVLTKYSEWLLSQRNNGWGVIDIHGPMKAALNAKRKNDPQFAFARDGVHANEEGHRIMSRQILAYGSMPEHPTSPRVLSLIRKRERILSDAWLTETGHKRPGMTKGLPIAEATRRAEELDTEIRKELNAQAPR